jgi:hypothetical protein
MLAGSNPIDGDSFLGRQKSAARLPSAFLRREIKDVGIMSKDFTTCQKLFEV